MITIHGAIKKGIIIQYWESLQFIIHDKFKMRNHYKKKFQ